MSINTAPRVSLGFSKERAALLLVFGRNIVTMMTGNPAFTTPYPPLASLATALDTLEATTEAAMDRSRQAIASRNAARAAVLSLLRQLSAYVQSHSVGDVAVLLSSGFVPIKVRHQSGPSPRHQPRSYVRDRSVARSPRAR